MSFFAKPNFIIYDEWFDDDLEKNKLKIKNKKISNIAKIHRFFYEKSIYKVGASENNMQLDITVNEKQLITKNYFKKSSEKYTSAVPKKIRLIKKLPKNKLKFSLTKKLIYSLSIFGFVLIFVFLMFLISQSRKSEPNINNQSFSLEKEF